MTQTSFVIAKTRVAPVKTSTIGTTSSTVRSQPSDVHHENFTTQKGMRIVYWSDSQIVLSWRSSNKRLQPFVHTRICKITQITGTHKWMFCPTSSNPADLITRGISTTMFYQNRALWFEGPSWLKAPNDQWPQVQSKEPITDIIDSPQMHIIVKSDSPNILDSIDLERYSTLNRAIRVTTTLLHYTDIWRKRNTKSTITTEIMQDARLALLKGTQRKYYEREITC
ncbi:uncharacterized protein [Montipora capricornis]|uniref:uncharacterized protein n=1 Tax=Montipora capricornis TaxID=246305 RepID=UPI0035F20D13